MLIRELATLLKANIPLIIALDILSKQYPPKIQALILTLKQDISAGASLSHAMRKHPKYFETLTVHVIKAGEASATLPEILESIATYQEKIILLKMRFKKALFYPLTVLSLSLLITLGLLIFIVPQFETLFQNMGAQLPWMTRLVLKAAEFVKTTGLWVIGILSLIIFMIFFIKKYSLRFSEFLSKLAQGFLGVPFIGSIYKKLIFSRFAHTLSILLKARIPLTEALKISSQVISFKKYESAIIHAREHIIKGDSLSKALEKNQQFPFIFLQFIYIGEQSGCLPDMLTKIGERYEMETDNTLNKLTLLLEPAIMLILGILIGGLVIAMYLPVFQLGKIV